MTDGEIPFTKRLSSAITDYIEGAPGAYVALVRSLDHGVDLDVFMASAGQLMGRALLRQTTANAELVRADEEVSLLRHFLHETAKRKHDWRDDE